MMNLAAIVLQLDGQRATWLAVLLLIFACVSPLGDAEAAVTKAGWIAPVLQKVFRGALPASGCREAAAWPPPARETFAAMPAAITDLVCTRLC